jgi:hypothetical protein
LLYESQRKDSSDAVDNLIVESTKGGSYGRVVRNVFALKATETIRTEMRATLKERGGAI